MVRLVRHLFLFSMFLFLILIPGLVQSANDRLTQSEIGLVAQFRAKVQHIIYKDWMNTDEYLVRWLRVKNRNLEGAREALQEAMEWRKSNNIDHILQEEFKDVEKEIPVILEGTDKLGHPISVLNFGAMDLRKVILSGRGERFQRFFTQCMEITEHVLRDGNANNATRALFILDIAGFNLRQHACVLCVPTLISMYRMYESYYPDWAYKMFALNTPRAFMPLYELARPFFSEPTRQALNLFDSNADRWKEALLQEVDADQLPKQYGGTRITYGKTISALKKTNPVIKAVFDRAEAEYLQTKPKSNISPSDSHTHFD